MNIKRVVAGGVLAGAVALGGIVLGTGAASAQPWNNHGIPGQYDHRDRGHDRDWNRDHDRDWRDRGPGPVFIAPPPPAPFFGS